MSEQNAELPSPLEERKRRYARTSRKYFLFSNLALMAWLIVWCFYVFSHSEVLPDVGGINVPGHTRPRSFGTALIIVLLFLTSSAGLTFNILAIVAGMKARRYGNIWGILSLFETPIMAVLFLGSLCAVMGWVWLPS